jgi:hypothetical protein
MGTLVVLSSVACTLGRSWTIFALAILRVCVQDLWNWHTRLDGGGSMMRLETTAGSRRQ